MTLTAEQFAQQMAAQLRAIDPDASAIVGTPERKIIDTVGLTLGSNTVDSTGLSSGLNINSKVGSNLDSFTSMFGMTRQQSTSGTGFVVFSRNSPATADITIASPVTIQSSQANVNVPTSIQYQTQAAGTIAQGETASAPVPVQCTFSGSAGNTSANTLTQIVGSLPVGVTAVTNPQAITNGADAEDDNSFKTRFANTWARNLAGTSSQYLALALSGAFTTKANCIGTQSTYQEYIQVPSSPDSSLPGGGGTTYTTAISDIAYAKQIYGGNINSNQLPTTPTFVSDNTNNPTYFYRAGTDYIFNPSPTVNNAELVGDVLLANATILATGQSITTGSSFNLQCYPNPEVAFDQADFPFNGTLLASSSDGTIGVIISYEGQSLTVNSTTGKVTNVEFTECTCIGEYTNGQFSANLPSTITLDSDTTVYQIPENATPNWTFLQVYSSNTTPPVGLQAVSPGDILLSQYDYISTASRNDLERNINNAVDIYVNGANDVSSSTVFLPAPQTFTLSANSAWYIENFRRDGEPSTRPQVGNLFTPLYLAPLDSLPSTIVVDNQTFYLGFHYWLVHEIGPLTGSIRARDGIEWNLLPGDSGSGPYDPTTGLLDNPQAPYTPTGPSANTWSADTAITVGEIVEPASSNGYWYLATVAGTTGSTHPTWPIHFESTVTDGSVTWLTIYAGQGSNMQEFNLAGMPVEVDNYTYDSNIVSMQAQIDQAKQITSDPLVHKALIRYFKFVVTVIYGAQQTASSVNSVMQTNLQAYLTSQYYGSIIQLSSVLETLGGTTGVQNIRWSNDLPNPPTQIRVIETDINGNELAGASVTRFRSGTSNAQETQLLTITGTPEGSTYFPGGLVQDNFSLSWTDTVHNISFTTANINFQDVYSAYNTGYVYENSEATATTPAAWIQTYINNAITAAGVTNAMYTGLTVTSNFWTNSDGTLQFIFTYGDGTPFLPVVTQQVTASSYTYDTDFFLLDDQLPSLPVNAASGDTVPGLIIQSRSQGTWLKGTA